MFLLKIVAVCILSLLLPYELFADSESSGQNTLRPVRRADFRMEYVNLKEGGDEEKYTLRAEEKFEIDDEFTLGFRVDLPVLTLDEEGEDFSAGLGDILLQKLLVQKINHRWRQACGIRTFLPTATTDETGANQWDIAPMIGFSADTHELRHGSFASFLMRYRFSALGASGRTERNRLELDFDLNFHLPAQFFVELTSDPTFDFEDNNRWSVPIGLELGRKIGSSFIVSVEPQFFVVDDTTERQFAIESRIGVFF